MNIHDIAPLICAAQAVKRKYTNAVDAHTVERRIAHANLAFYQAQTAQEVIDAIIHAATTEASHV
jgi:hypothetical protein